MGFADISGHLIMFIAVTTISISLLFVFNQQISDSASSVSIRQKYLSNQLKTSIDIDSISYNSGNLLIYIRNTGDTNFYPNKSSIYIDKERIKFDSDMSFVIESDTDLKNVGVFDPSEILKISINKTLTPDETHTFLIVTPYDARSSYEFST